MPEYRLVSRERARLLFALTAACVLAGIVIFTIHTGNAPPRDPRHFHQPWQRALNVFAFFTVQSNVLVALSCTLLTLRPERNSTAFAALRLTSLLAITVTGVVYHTVLAGLLDLQSWAKVADELLHTVVPVLAVAGWLLAGPRRLTGRRITLLSFIFPLGWLAFTLIRGAAIHWYSYPFINVDQLGYARVIVNCVWVTLLWLGLCAAATAADRPLARIGAEAKPAVAPTR